METSIKKKKKNLKPRHVLVCAFTCELILSACGSSLTHTVCCVTPVLRGHPSAIWRSTSHQSWWKAGQRPSTMTDWREARNSSPWLKAYRPGARGWQDPAMRVWWMGSGTGLVICISVYARIHMHAQAHTHAYTQNSYFEGKVMIGCTVKQNERTSLRSSYTLNFCSLGSNRHVDKYRNVNCKDSI